MNLIRNGRVIAVQTVCTPIAEEDVHAVVLRYADVLSLYRMDAEELLDVVQDLVHSFKKDL